VAEGIHGWRKGVDVESEMSLFADGKGDGSNVFFCSDAFSLNAGWVEGALEASHAVLAMLDDRISMNVEEVDVAVVGAGIAGCYLAMRLAQETPGARIALYEGKDRVGGRCAPYSRDPEDPSWKATASESPGLEDVWDELGGERSVFGPRHTSEFEELGGSAYFEDVHKLVRKLAMGYNMPSKAVDAYDGYFSSETECVPLQGDTRADSILTSAVAKFWESNSHVSLARDPVKEKELQISFGQFCKEFGITPEDERFWTSYSGNNMFPSNCSAAQLIAHPDEYMEREDARLLLDGFQRLARNFVRDSGATLRLCHSCKALTFGAGGKVVLHFPKQDRVCLAERVVLCMTKMQVLQLSAASPGVLSPEREKALWSLVPVAQLRMVLRWQFPWWYKIGLFNGRTTTTARLRQIHYYNQTTMVVSLSGNAAEEWHHKCQYSETKAMQEAYHEIMQLHRKLPGGDTLEVPPPDNFEWIYWSCGMHRWSLGVDVGSTLRLLQLGAHTAEERGGPVFLAGEAFTLRPGCVEGALESVERLFAERFFSDQAAAAAEMSDSD
jgi:monoamine oxidase